MRVYDNYYGAAAPPGEDGSHGAGGSGGGGIATSGIGTFGVAFVAGLLLFAAIKGND